MKPNIENYDSMTLEEKLAALEAYEPDMSGFVSKATFDKTASDLAAAKKALKEKMSEEEAKLAKEAEERAALLARVTELENERAINNYVNSYLGIGYDEKLARSTAEALAKGDMATVFANQKNYNESREKALKAELLKATPTPAAGSTVTITKDDMKKMTLAEQVKFASENPEQYKELYGGN